MKSAVEVERFTGSILIANNGKPIVSRGYGIANIEYDAQNNPTTVFRLASVSKQITAAAIAVTRGNLSCGALPMINYNNKQFRPISNAENSEASAETVFYYKQDGNILTTEYCGGKIKEGLLIGLVDNEGKIEMRYSQINENNELMTGIGVSTPKILPNGKIRLRENWQWTSGDFSKGNSVIEEI